MSKRPNQALYPILHSIETTVLQLTEEYPKLKDKDIEWCYEKLKDFYRKQSQGRACDEPISSSEAKQNLMDEILNILDTREEENLDSDLLNQQHLANVYANLHEVYASCFNSLIASVRLWRKEKNVPGYLSYIRKNVL